MEDHIWFSIGASLKKALPPEIVTVEEVARATSRTVAAVRRALADGRLPAARWPGSPSQGRRGSAHVRATPVDLATWRRIPLEEALRARPDLPQAPDGWRSQAEIARALGGSQSRARRLVRLTNPPSLTWGGPPWRRETRFWIPDPEEAVSAIEEGRS